MADWVHCNVCFHQPGDGRKFSLTSCGHIFCADCVTKGTKEKCTICGCPCTTIQLTAKMKQDVEVYFTNPLELAKRNFKQLSQVMDFQYNHRQRLTAYNREQLAKQGSLGQKAQKAIQKAADLEREVMVLQEENAYLKKLISKGQQTRPSGNRPGSAGSSPVRGLGHSPGQSTSPMAMRGQGTKSPYNQQDNAVSSGQQSSFIPSSKRLTVRTPPSHGRLGVIPGTPSMPGTHMTRDGTPGNYPEGTGTTPSRGTNSPMNVSSPNTHVARQIGLHHTISLPKTPTTSSQAVAMFITPTQSPVNRITTSCSGPSWDESRKQIKLHYTSQPSGISARLAIQNRHRVCQQKIQTLQAENANLRAEMVLQTKNLKTSQDELVGLHNELATCTEGIQRSQLLQAQQEICALRALLQCAKEQKEQAQESDKWTDVRKEMEVTKLEEKIKTLQQGIEEEQNARNELEQRCNMLASECGQYKAELEQSEHQRDIATNEADVYKQKHQDSKVLVETLELKCSELEAKIRKLDEKAPPKVELKKLCNTLTQTSDSYNSDDFSQQSAEYITGNMATLAFPSTPLSPTTVCDNQVTTTTPSENGSIPAATLKKHAKTKDKVCEIGLNPITEKDTHQENDFQLHPQEPMYETTERHPTIRFTDVFELDITREKSPAGLGTVVTWRTPSVKNPCAESGPSGGSGILQTPCRQLLLKPISSGPGRKRKFTAVIQEEQPSPNKDGSPLRPATGQKPSTSPWLGTSPSATSALPAGTPKSVKKRCRRKCQLMYKRKGTQKRKTATFQQDVTPVRQCHAESSVYGSATTTGLTIPLTDLVIPNCLMNPEVIDSLLCNCNDLLPDQQVPMSPQDIFV